MSECHKAFDLIKAFVQDLASVHKDQHALALYARLLTHTSASSHPQVAARHVEVFRHFCSTHADAIRAGQWPDDASPVVIAFSDRVFVDARQVVQTPDEWERLLAVQAAVQGPAGPCTGTVCPFVQEAGNGGKQLNFAGMLNEMVSTIQKSVLGENAEGKSLLEHAETTDPAQIIQAIVKSGAVEQLATQVKTAFEETKPELTDILAGIQEFCTGADSPMTAGIDGEQLQAQLFSMLPGVLSAASQMNPDDALLPQNIELLMSTLNMQLHN